LTARPPAPAGGEETPCSGGKLAETDNADTGNLDKSEGVLTAANRDWLGRILWDGPPPVAHLQSFVPDAHPLVPLTSGAHANRPSASGPPVPVAVPADLFDGFADIGSIEIIGLPEGAAMNAGHAAGEGVWRLAAGDVEGLELLPADDQWSIANLTVKVTATEEATGDKVTNMAAIRMEIAGSPPAEPETGEAAEPPDKQMDKAEEASEEASPEPDAGTPAVDIRHLVPPPPEPRPQPESPAEEATAAPPDPAASETPEEPAPPAQETVAEDADAGQAEPSPAEPEDMPAEPETKTASIKLQPVKAAAKAPAQPSPKKTAGASVRLRPATVRQAPAPAAKPSEQPETPPTAKPAARKAGVVLKKPEKQAPPPTPPLTPPPTPGDRRQPTGEIVVRLGGAPERGDPHYRIAVDGRQVASGNVDWALGLPAVEDGSEAAICWQTVRFPWDFAAVVPDEISLRYELGHGSGGEEAGALLVDWVDVDGLRVRDGDAYAHADGGRIPWPGSDRLKSWVGELVFDVAGAFAGEPRRKRDKKADGTASSADADDEAGKAAPVPAPQPLVVHVSEDDAADRVVMSELAALRSFVRGQDDPRIDPGRQGTYDRLGLASGSWSDVVAIGPNGDELDLDGDSDTRRFLVAAGEQLKRKFLTEATQRALPDGRETGSGDREADDRPTPAKVPLEAGREIKRKFLSGVIDRLPFLAASGSAEPPEAVAPEDAPHAGSSAVFDRAFDVKRRFLDGVLGKGMSRLETVLKRSKDRPIPVVTPLAPAADDTVEPLVPVRIGDGNPISKRQAARTVRRYYGRTLKRALDKLQSTVFEGRQPAPQSSQSEIHHASLGSMAGGPGEAATRDFAERMRSEFFDNAMRKAMTRGTSRGIDGHS